MYQTSLIIQVDCDQCPDSIGKVFGEYSVIFRINQKGSFTRYTKIKNIAEWTSFSLSDFKLMTNVQDNPFKYQRKVGLIPK